MVKGISRQVIVVKAPEPELFEQAIFILKDNVGPGITDEALLKQARRLIHDSDTPARRRRIFLYGAFWAGLGALSTGLVWLLTVLI